MSRNLLFLIILLVSTSHWAIAQCEPTKNKRANGLYNKAIMYANYDENEAISLLKSAVRYKHSYYEAYYLLGEIIFSQIKRKESNFEHQGLAEKYREAETYYENVVKYCPSYKEYDAYLKLGDLYYSDHQMQKAKSAYTKYINSINDSTSKIYKKAKQKIEWIEEYQYLIKHPVPFSPVLVRGVCSPDDEFLPVLAPDGSRMFFTRRYKKTVNGVNKYVEELMWSGRIEKSDSTEIYTPAEPMPPPFNDGRLQGGITITIDNKTLYITICDYERTEISTVRNCDIYYTIFENGKWEPLRKFGRKINGQDSFEGQPSITNDGKTLYFASDRDGGFGGFDIYKIVKNDKGMWSEPINLGPVINTEKDEKTPFIHTDGKTLYFASNGHGGIGGYDIFVTKTDKNGNWTKPQNIGYPINTVGDEVAYTVSTNGKKLYFSSKSYNGLGGWDIFSADLPENKRPQKVILLHGKITDNKGRGITNASVELTSLRTFEKTTGFVDKKTGIYAVSSPVTKDEDFLLTVKRHGYFFASTIIDPDSAKYDPPTNIDVKVKKITPNVPVKLENVHFEFNSDSLTYDSRITLDNLVEFLKENPTIKIEIHGHTDNIGTEEDNMDLAERRAKSVIKYLTKKGIYASRLSYKAFGETQPVASNKTEKGRALNRRVEFVVKK